MITSLEPLTGKDYIDLHLHEWNTLQVTLDITNLPPDNDMEMEHGSRSIVYDKYIHELFTIIEYKKKEESMQEKNQFIQARVTSLENKK